MLVITLTQLAHCGNANRILNSVSQANVASTRIPQSRLAPCAERARSSEGIQTSNCNTHCGAWLLVAFCPDVQLHAPQLPAGYKAQAHCLRSEGFVSRSVPEFELRNPGCTHR